MEDKSLKTSGLEHWLSEIDYNLGIPTPHTLKGSGEIKA